MDTKNLKRWVLGGGVGAFTTLFVVNVPLFGFCKYGAGTQFCYGNILFPEVVSDLIFFLSLSLIFLSLLTYWAKDEVFLAWWNFAKWWVPVIIATTLFFELKGGGGGGFGISSGLDEFVILSLFYIIFIITSLTKIIRAYWRTRKGK